MNAEFNLDVYSAFAKQNMMFPAYMREDPDGRRYAVVTHNGLKSYMLSYMAEMAKQGNPVKVSYTPIETGISHSIVSCTICLGGYQVTETGESSIATLNTAVAKNYPYLQAELRAFDRVVISFLQLNIDGRRVYSAEEIT